MFKKIALTIHYICISQLHCFIVVLLVIMNLRVSSFALTALPSTRKEKAQF